MTTTVPPPLRVLLIEDSDEYALLVTRLLDELPAQLPADAPALECVRVADGDDAADLALRADWDLVICDIELPGRSGLEVLPLLRGRSRHAKVVVLTAHQRFDYARDAVRYGDALLTKPVVRGEFLATCRELCLAVLAARERSRPSVLAIGAHPDDVEIGCGGSLARFRAQGAEVDILVLTGGEGGGSSQSRRSEAERAAAVLGARLHVASLPDRVLSGGPATISAIENVLAQRHYSHVLTHAETDAHQDHRAAHAATVVASRGVGNLLCYQSPSTTVAFQPNFYIEISAHLPVKLAAIAAHASQTTRRAYLADDMISATARYWGRFCGYGLAEPFVALRMTEA